MRKSRILVFLLIIILVISVAGCQWIRDAADQPKETKSVRPSVSSAASALPTQAEQELLPLDVFTSFAEYTAPDISPDGSMILYRHITSFSDSVIAENWQSGEKTTIPWPQVQGIPHFFWAPDGQNVLFFVDDMGDENYGIYTTNVATGKSKTILSAGDNNCYYVADNPENDKEIYIEKLENGYYDLYLLNYDTGKLSLVLKNPGNISSYIFDYDGNLRLVTTVDENAGEHVLEKIGSAGGTEFLQSDWKEIIYWDYDNASTSGTWSIMPDGKRLLYMDSSIKNTTALYSYDLETGEKTEIFNDPDYDLSGGWTDLETGEVTAVTVYSYMNEWHVLDQSFQDDYDALSAIGEDFDIFGSSEDDEYWLVSYTYDTKAEDYYIYDMKTNKATLLFNSQPDLLDYEFSSTDLFSFEASDGLKIEGYATFPTGEGRSGLPTVLLVHGGPWSRDIWGFDPEVQFLASRGYLVLQVNYRGSTGYGKDFIRAGDKEWGGKMHQDILDAVNFAVSQGWADKDRIGVYGASYGGYEALACAAFSSDVFKCAIDAFGPSDLVSFMEELPPQWSVDAERLLRAVGDPSVESEAMKQRSPYYYADDVKIPVLIAQGANDPRVLQKQSDIMVDALETAGADVDYLLYEDMGHGFSSLEYRQDFYSHMEDFFAEYLGGKTE